VSSSVAHGFTSNPARQQVEILQAGSAFFIENSEKNI
jgi:hypothetical protein